MHWLLAVHAAATLFMTGVIWFVQIVHYPLFALVGQDRFAGYEKTHSGLTTVVVAPPMLAEALASIVLLFRRPPHWPEWAAWAGVGLVAVVWASTFFLQMPRHAELSNGFEPSVHRFLVTSNWLRTAAWSLRATLVLWLTFRPAS